MQSAVRRSAVCTEKEGVCVMIYRDFQDLKLSGLGMGAMRLPVIDGDDAKIDEKAAAELID